MPRFTLIIFDREDATRSDVMYYDTITTSIVPAFEEAVQAYYKDADIRIKGKMCINHDMLCEDGEEYSHLFFES